MTPNYSKIAEDIIDETTRPMFRSYKDAEDWSRHFANDALKDKKEMKERLAAALLQAHKEGEVEERERCRLVVSAILGENARGFQKPGRVSNATRAVDSALTEAINGIKGPDIDAFNAASLVEAGRGKKDIVDRFDSDKGQEMLADLLDATDELVAVATPKTCEECGKPRCKESIAGKCERRIETEAYFSFCHGCPK